MAAVIHTFEKVTIIRVRKEVRDDGSTGQMLYVDSDHVDRNDVLATLLRAQNHVMDNGGYFHKKIKVAGLDGEEEDD